MESDRYIQPSPIKIEEFSNSQPDSLMDKVKKDEDLTCFYENQIMKLLENAAKAPDNG